MSFSVNPSVPDIGRGCLSGKYPTKIVDVIACLIKYLLQVPKNEYIFDDTMTMVVGARRVMTVLENMVIKEIILRSNTIINYGNPAWSVRFNLKRAVDRLVN